MHKCDLSIYACQKFKFNVTSSTLFSRIIIIIIIIIIKLKICGKCNFKNVIFVFFKTVGCRLKANCLLVGPGPI